MKNKIVYFIFIFATILKLYSIDNTSDTVKDELYINSIDILQYGIEEEVVKLLKILPDNLKNEIYTLLLDRYKTALLNETKIKLIDYFSNCKNIPDFILNYLYEESEKEPNDTRLFTTLLKFLGKVGKKREGLFLIKKLDSDNKMIAITAADAISNIKDREVITPLLERLKLADTNDDKILSDDIKSKLILFFGEIKAVEAKEYLRSKLEDTLSGRFVIAYSMFSLAKINDTDAIKLIEKRISDPDVLLQEYASYAISQFESNEVVPILKNMLRHNNEKVRINACKGIVLNKVSDADRILLYKYKNDPSPTVRKEALKSIVSLGSIGIKTLVSDNKKTVFSTPDLAVISETVSMSPDEDKLKFLIELYDNSDDEGKESITRGLVNCRDKRIDPLLKKILYSDKFQLRIGALKIISNINDSSLWNDVKEISENDKLEAMRKAAKRYLELR